MTAASGWWAEACRARHRRAGAPEPPDQPARDDVAAGLEATLLVVAGAGSGKTTHLVDRVVGILVTGAAEVGHVAAITFTESAAAELRDRVAERLEGVAAGDDPKLPDSARAAARTALEGLDGAALTTLHGFARRILAQYPVAAGLPPSFEVRDEVASAADLDAHWTELLDGFLDQPASRLALQRLLACGARLPTLRTAARDLAAHWHLIAAPTGGVAASRAQGRCPPGGWTPDRSWRTSTPHSPVAAGAPTPTTASFARLGSAEALALRLEDGAGDELATLRLLAGAELRPGTMGQDRSWGGRKAEVAGHLTAAVDAAAETVRAVTAEALAVLGVLLGRQVLDLAGRRHHEGRLDYHDLLVLARDLVRAHPAVRAELHDQYRFVLIDEYQDTDPLQAELAVLIAAGAALPDVGPAAWHLIAPVVGRLFFVGDPHQSIYRFRHADVEVFARTRRDVATRVAVLTTNFRSVPGVVDWVNHVFDRLIGDGQPEVGLAYAPAEPDRAPHRWSGSGEEETAASLR